MSIQDEIWAGIVSLLTIIVVVNSCRQYKAASAWNAIKILAYMHVPCMWRLQYNIEVAIALCIQAAEDTVKQKVLCCWYIYIDLIGHGGKCHTYMKYTAQFVFGH